MMSYPSYKNTFSIIYTAEKTSDIHFCQAGELLKQFSQKPLRLQHRNKRRRLGGMEWGRSTPGLGR